MRLFIALDLPPLDLFTNLQKKLHHPDLRTVNSFHLTLKFLGEMPPSLVENIIVDLSTLSMSSLTLTFDHIGFFPNSSHPQVVWVGVKEQEEIILVSKKIDTALSLIAAPEKHFHPHVTLARVKRLSTPTPWMKTILGLPFPSTTIVSSSFSLIQSTLTPQGPTYTVLKEFSLR